MMLAMLLLSIKNPLWPDIRQFGKTYDRENSGKRALVAKSNSQVPTPLI